MKPHGGESGGPAERVGRTKWYVGDEVYWRDRDRVIVWTVQPGPTTEGPSFVHITAPVRSAVVRQDELVLVDPWKDRP